MNQVWNQGIKESLQWGTVYGNSLSLIIPETPMMTSRFMKILPSD